MIKKHKYIRLLIPIIIVLITVSAFYNGLTVKTYTVKTEEINEGSSVRIVLLSDLHSIIHGNDQGPLIAKIKQQNPDLILLAGDIADDKTQIHGTRLLLAGIQDVAPIYYVTGNHEYWSWNIAEILDEIRKFGVTILSDEYVEIEINGNNLVIAGIEDPDKRKYGSPDYDQLKSM